MSISIALYLLFYPYVLSVSTWKIDKWNLKASVNTGQHKYESTRAGCIKKKKTLAAKEGKDEFIQLHIYMHIYKIFI